MFIDTQDLKQSELPHADICIVGAGAAGLSMASRLADKNILVVMLESGGSRSEALAPDFAADVLNAGTSSLSDYPFVKSRSRGLGGTTALWTGACVPLDTDDFEERDWIPHSGWPISADDLAPYYESAAPLFGMVETEEFEHRLQRGPFHLGALEARFAQLTTRPHFGENHRNLVRRSANITCVLGATVTGFHTNGVGRQISALQIGDLEGNSFTVHARLIVLATGGIEAPRLLLSAGQEMQAAMGSSANVVGRYHMEHPIRSLGTIQIPNARHSAIGFTNIEKSKNAKLQGLFGLTPEVRRRERLLNLHFRAYRFNALENDSAIVRLKDVATRERLQLSNLKLSETSKYVSYGAWHVWNKVAPNAYFDHIRLLAFIEQEPDPENRITLSNKLDRFGQRLPHLEFKESDQMKASVDKTLDLVGQHLNDNGLWEFSLRELDHLRHYGGYGLHHMGATRMSADPCKGVVDANCRVHGLDNLYIASSSVFTTGGAANPTLTISALALRLTEHLDNVLLEI